ncbi:efflux pump antibiotic resistance protein [Niveomyces insectorum RCEF 264]|uniref:Efflux pump antibiotic resistance protein n=1 Tax=Niveomyces insectorum RCEF 264 TaxID=1081102 RepID=A0A162KBJ4_9HYPO|nr:efflux pump antibiotic resistance protein [Niveomyces insectorum RCEF 264]
MLIVFRALQGIGGGSILTTVQTIVSDVVTLEQRGAWEGILGAVVSVANAIGPLVGGVFTEKASWRWCFYVNIPLISVSIGVALFGLPLKHVAGDIRRKLGQIDYTGSFLLLMASVLILLPVSWGGSLYAWNSAGVLAPLVLGVACLVPFVYVEMNVAVLPVLPLHIFKDRTVFGILFGTFFTGFAFYIGLYYLPQFYQVVRSATPIKSGLLILPLVVSQTSTSLVTGVLVSKTGKYVLPMVVGYFAWTVGCGLLSLVSPTISDGHMIGFQLLCGIGAGSTFMTGIIAMQASLPRNQMSVATGARNFLRLLGGTIGLAVAAAILNNSIKNELSAVLPESALNVVISDPTQIRSPSLGLTPSEQTAALLAYITTFCVNQKTLKREDDERLKAEAKVWIKKRGGVSVGAWRNDRDKSQGESRAVELTNTPARGILQSEGEPAASAISDMQEQPNQDKS